MDRLVVSCTEALNLISLYASHGQKEAHFFLNQLLPEASLCCDYDAHGGCLWLSVICKKMEKHSESAIAMFLEWVIVTNALLSFNFLFFFAINLKFET
jgi:hypothetical protein